MVVVAVWAEDVKVSMRPIERETNRERMRGRREKAM